MSEKKEYRSAKRSRKMIREAFLELLREKSFEKITVTDIVSRADLNRSTFYAHYPDVRGVVEEIENEVFTQNLNALSEMKYGNIFKNPEAYLKNLNEVIIENVELYRLLMETTYIQNQMEKIKKILVDDVVNAIELPDNTEDINLFKIRCNFFVGGIVNTYQQWLRGDLNCSIDEITKEMMRIIKESAKEFIEIK